MPIEKKKRNDGQKKTWKTTDKKTKTKKRKGKKKQKKKTKNKTKQNKNMNITAALTIYGDMIYDKIGCPFTILLLIKT